MDDTKIEMDDTKIELFININNDILYLKKEFYKSTIYYRDVIKDIKEFNNKKIKKLFENIIKNLKVFMLNPNQKLIKEQIEEHYNKFGISYNYLDAIMENMIILREIYQDVDYKLKQMKSFSQIFQRNKLEKYKAYCFDIVGLFQTIISLNKEEPLFKPESVVDYDKAFSSSSSSRSRSRSSPPPTSSHSSPSSPPHSPYSPPPPPTPIGGKRTRKSKSKKRNTKRYKKKTRKYRK